MNFSCPRIVCFCLAVSIMAIAGSQTNAQNVLTIPTMTTAPTMNGLIGAGEWDTASGGRVNLAPATARLVDVANQGRFRIGRVNNDLVFMYIINKMNALPTGPSWPLRDADLLTGDAVELILKANGETFDFVFNHTGVFYDARDGDAGWDSFHHPLEPSAMLMTVW